MKFTLVLTFNSNNTDQKVNLCTINFNFSISQLLLILRISELFCSMCFIELKVGQVCLQVCYSIHP